MAGTLVLEETSPVRPCCRVGCDGIGDQKVAIQTVGAVSVEDKPAVQVGAPVTEPVVRVSGRNTEGESPTGVTRSSGSGNVMECSPCAWDRDFAIAPKV